MASPTELRLGVLAASGKENEHRLPIHPEHFRRIEPGLRARIVLETGYGRHYGVSDEQLAPLVAQIVPRDRVIATTDIVLLPKPTLADVADLRDGQVLWGWPHCVQDLELTQLAIDRHLTLIAWEAMNLLTPSGGFMVHVFHLNNEIAGYASVMQAMTLSGFTGHYGRKRRAVVIGFGNTARGAVIALNALGILDVVVLTMREVHSVASPMPTTVLGGLEPIPGEPGHTRVLKASGPVPTSEFLAEFDIVVNCVLQDTDAPLMFVSGDEIDRFRTGSLIVDVSCDEAMGFDFARPTTFEEPMLMVGAGVHYYAVDHSPSFLWESATWENSEALMPHLDAVMSGPSGWDASRPIHDAIEIRDGVVQNRKILSFQHRSPEYPHRLIGD
jgi:alanine dehydrogenase